MLTLVPVFRDGKGKIVSSISTNAKVKIVLKMEFVKIYKEVINVTVLLDLPVFIVKPTLMSVPPIRVNTMVNVRTGLMTFGVTVMRDTSVICANMKTFACITHVGITALATRLKTSLPVNVLLLGPG